MAVKFQYNKTSLHQLGKQLKIRRQALPTLKSKESALRLEVKRAQQQSDALEAKLQRELQRYEEMHALWTEFTPGLIRVLDVELETVKIAGVKTPQLKEVRYQVKPYSVFSMPAWFTDGVQILQRLAQTGIEAQVYLEKKRLLDQARKKTTQKVNLYEKVQIPGFQEAIRKIKRYMEDEENLSKAGQKIVKLRHQTEEMEEAL